MQTEQNGKEYQGIRVLETFEATEVFEYNKVKNDFIVITKKPKVF